MTQCLICDCSSQAAALLSASKVKGICFLLFPWVAVIDCIYTCMHLSNLVTGNPRSSIHTSLYHVECEELHFLSPLLTDSKMFGYSAVFSFEHTWLPNHVVNTAWKTQFTLFPTVLCYYFQLIYIGIHDLQLLPGPSMEVTAHGYSVEQRKSLYLANDCVGCVQTGTLYYLTTMS